MYIFKDLDVLIQKKIILHARWMDNFWDLKSKFLGVYHETLQGS